MDCLFLIEYLFTWKCFWSEGFAHGSIEVLTTFHGKRWSQVPVLHEFGVFKRINSSRYALIEYEYYETGINGILIHGISKDSF